MLFINSSFSSYPKDAPKKELNCNTTRQKLTIYMSLSLQSLSKCNIVFQKIY